jgi:protein-S-isoprenylcysteine O-methyltransferase Ste14
MLMDDRYLNALRHQPQLEILANPALKAIASILFVGGQVVTLSSMWVLGTTGTFFHPKQDPPSALLLQLQAGSLRSKYGASASAPPSSPVTLALPAMLADALAGTYLGDYFNILMPHRVTGFPFNILSDPMYVGSSITHFGTALWYQSPLGVLLSGFVWAVYMAALRFEGYVRGAGPPPPPPPLHPQKSNRADGV